MRRADLAIADMAASEAGVEPAPEPAPGPAEPELEPLRLRRLRGDGFFEVPAADRVSTAIWWGRGLAGGSCEEPSGLNAALWFQLGRCRSVKEFEKLNRIGEGTYGIVCECGLCLPGGGGRAGPGGALGVNFRSLPG